MRERLTTYDTEILKEYYGWYRHEYTAQALADKHHITVEQVRVIVNMALRSLRHYSNKILRKHHDLMAHQIYQTEDPTKYKAPDVIHTMAIELIKFYATLGALVTINERLAVITENR